MTPEFKPVIWSETVAQHLSGTTDQFYSLADMQADVEAKRLTLGGIFAPHHVASFLLRDDGQELVVVAVGGETLNGSVVKVVYDYIQKLARDLKKTSVRAHTHKPGVARLLQRAGAKLDEYIYRIDLGEAYGR